MSAVASTSKRCASFSFQPLSYTRGGVGRQQPASRRDVSSSTSSGNKNATNNNNNNNNNGEEMPELTAFDAVGGLLKASTGGIAVFGLGAVGVIGVASFAANVSKQFIADGGGGKEKTKRELLLDELNELKAEEDTWGNRRRQRKIKGELKKLVDEM